MPGFESSAPNGEGLGIDAFRPQKNSIKLSNKMFLPEEALERLKEQVSLPALSCNDAGTSHATLAQP